MSLAAGVSRRLRFNRVTEPLHTLGNLTQFLALVFVVWFFFFKFHVYYFSNTTTSSRNAFSVAVLASAKLSVTGLLRRWG